MSSWKLFAAGSALFAALTTIFAKMGVEKIPSNLATLLRTFVVTGFLIVLVFGRGEWMNPSKLSSRSILFLILSGLATGLSWICYYRALQLGPAAGVAPIDKLSLLITIVLAVLFLGERLNPVQWIGACLMGVGAMMVAIH